MNDLTQAVPAEIAAESKFQWLTRIGFLGRGILYITIGILAIGTGRTEDLTGALEYVGTGTGRILLMIIAAGLFAYALWRLSDAAFGTEHGSGDWKSLRKRLAAAGVGIIYLFMSYKALRILTVGRADTSQPQEQAGTVLNLPGGWMMLAVAGAFMLGAGFFQLYKAGKCSFLKNLDADCITDTIRWLGRIGYAARGVIFLAVGWMLGRAALAGRADQAGGMEQALDLFDGGSLYAVAGGLILFGAFSIVEARYRIIHRPPHAQAVAAKVKNAVS